MFTCLFLGLSGLFLFISLFFYTVSLKYHYCFIIVLIVIGIKINIFNYYKYISSTFSSYWTSDAC